jgi:hypothetical protein
MSASVQGEQPGARDLPFRGAVGRVTSILCIPYGFTVSLWCAGGLTVARFGRPTPAEVILFGVGAAAAFLALAFVGRPHLDAEVPMRVPAIAVANVVPILVALLVEAVPFELLGRRAAFLACGGLATGGYVIGMVALIRLARRRPRA